MARKITSTTDELDSIRQLLSKNQHAEAQTNLESLIRQLPLDDLLLAKDEIETVLAGFLPKRHRILTQILSDQVNAKQPELSQSSRFQQYLREEFLRLSDHNIFDWDTSYKPFLSSVFKQVLSDSTSNSKTAVVFPHLREEAKRHSREIFQKGYLYRKQHDEASARILALRGVQRFYELPVQIYLDNLRLVNSPSAASVSRRTCSSILSGILQGFAESEFGDHTGTTILLASDFWQSSIPLLTKHDFLVLEPRLQQYRSGHSIRTSVLPLLDAIDKILSQPESPKSYCLPQVITWDSKRQRFEVVLVLPEMAQEACSIRLVCYLMKEFVHLHEIQQQIVRGAQIIVAPLTPALDEAVTQDVELRERIINTTHKTSRQTDAQSEEICRSIRHELSIAIGTQSDAPPLAYNFAADFPLEKSEVAEMFYVDRPSVRGLIPSLNERSGVRLWTSLRRSGKTTSCIKLAAQNVTAGVVFQTCQFTDQSDYANILINEVKAAVDAGIRVKGDFLQKLVEKCSATTLRPGARFVLIIDEYESLFEELDNAVMRDKSLQGLVAEPILNQMLSLSRQNLVILIGQRPDAHFILMERNQLSPCILHESFPLFAHRVGELQTEFCDLLTKALTYRIPFESTFSDLLYNETHGHPFLTINVLRDFLDWVIDERLVVQGQALTGDHFVLYATSQFQSEHLRTSKHFEMFRRLVSQYLSARSRDTLPWLYAVHEIMRELAIRYPGEFRCGLEELRDIYRQRGLDNLRIDRDALLEDASRGNFFAVSEGSVMPRIPLIARIAGIASSGV
jgi:hypothetical protein